MTDDRKDQDGPVGTDRARHGRVSAPERAGEMGDRPRQGDTARVDRRVDRRVDPRGLIRESYRIAGISMAECRSIFLDWVLGLPVDADARAMIRPLLGRHEREFPDHPMTRILRQGLEQPIRHPRRRNRHRRRAPSASQDADRDATP